MFKWLFRIGLAFLVTKLAEEYLHPSPANNAKSRAHRRTPNRRKKE
jgi:hypothetical protein